MRTHDRARLAETKATNTSLSALKDCVRLQREAQAQPRVGGEAAAAHVPYRRSKLTRLLRPFLHASTGDGTAACVIAHLAPLRSAGKHSASTLEFVGSLCGVTRAAIERDAFNAVERWNPAEVVAWVGALEGGKYAHLACCFAGAIATASPLFPALPPLPRQHLTQNLAPDPSLRSRTVPSLWRSPRPAADRFAHFGGSLRQG